MGLVHALVDAFWVSCDACGDVTDDKNHDTRGSATTSAEDDHGFVRVGDRWLCPKCIPPSSPQGDTPPGPQVKR